MEKMTVLGISTSGQRCNLCVERDSGLKAECSFEHEMALLRTLVPRIDRLLTECELGPEDVDLYVVDLGPGSFTGVRIGVMTAKALAWALRRPVMGVTSLEALAMAATPAHNATVLTVVRARPAHLYWQAFRQEGESLNPLALPAMRAISALGGELRSLGVQKCHIRACDVRPDELADLLSSLETAGVVATWEHAHVEARHLVARASHAMHNAPARDPLLLTPCYVAPPNIGVKRTRPSA